MIELLKRKPGRMAAKIAIKKLIKTGTVGILIIFVRGFNRINLMGFREIGLISKGYKI
jgi:hypothetical protein